MKNTSVNIDLNTHAAVNTAITDQPALYCGTYAKYNNGSIYGKWIDLTECADRDEFYAICAEIHKDEEDPEFMFQDTQGYPKSLYCESDASDELFEYLEAIKGMDADRKEAYEIYINGGYDVSDFDESYQGMYKDEEDYAYELVQDCYDLDKIMGSLSSYFDYEKFARDLFMSDYWYESGHVFRNL